MVTHLASLKRDIAIFIFALCLLLLCTNAEELSSLNRNDYNEPERVKLFQDEGREENSVAGVKEQKYAWNDLIDELNEISITIESIPLIENTVVILADLKEEFKTQVSKAIGNICFKLGKFAQENIDTTSETAVIKLVSRFSQIVELDLSAANANQFFLIGSEWGDPDCLFELAMYHSMQNDLQRATTELYFSSLGGSISAQIALGYRYDIGLGVPKSCPSALAYYSSAATLVVPSIRSLGVEIIDERPRLDLGARGPTRHELREFHNLAQYKGTSSDEEDVLDYLKHNADKGDTTSQYRLAQYYFNGLRGTPQNYQSALHYFSLAADAGDMVSMSMLGLIYLNNLTAIEESMVSEAENRFRTVYDIESAKISKLAKGIAANGLGYIELYARAIPDYRKATEYFEAAVLVNNADSHYNLGVLYLTGNYAKHGQVIDLPNAIQHFNAAAKQGHVLSLYQLGKMMIDGMGVKFNCNQAVRHFQAVLEKAGPAYEHLVKAQDAYEVGSFSQALQHYLLAAELGNELGQNNAAVLMDRGVSHVYTQSHRAYTYQRSMGLVNEELNFGPQLFESILGSWVDDIGKISGNPDSLRILFLASKRGNLEATVKLADYFYYKFIDTSDMGKFDIEHEEILKDNLEIAAHYYKKAKDAGHYQAKFNLGFMHQFGLGVEQDFHLAKRYYDESRQDGLSIAWNLPATLALLFLRLHWIAEEFLIVDAASYFRRMDFFGSVSILPDVVTEPYLISSEYQPELDFMQLETDTQVAIGLFLCLVVVVMIRRIRGRETLR